MKSAELGGIMDLCVQSELSRNPDQNMHSHFSERKQTWSKNYRNRSSQQTQFGDPNRDYSEAETIKNLIKSANAQLNIMINGPTYKREYPTLVQVYIVFLKVGEIDNVKERFQADAYIEAIWVDNTIEPRHMIHFDPKAYWNPELYIENSLGNLNSMVKYKTEKSDDGTIKVIEMRTIKGSFWEKLELGEFPLDIQDLSITITSHRNKEEVIIDLSKDKECVINTEEFRMQQEWTLYPHINTETRFIYDIKSEYEKPAFTFSSKIARRPGYFIYNAYMLIFMISGLGFVPFSFAAYSPHFRIQTTCLLILSSVNFRWIVTSRLPTVSYLTTLDLYAIGALVFLVLLCCWHAIIGTFLLNDIMDTPLRIEIDFYALYVISSVYVIFHVVYIIFFLIKYLRYGNITKEEEENEKLKNLMTETLNQEKIIARKIEVGIDDSQIKYRNNSSAKEAL